MLELDLTAAIEVLGRRHDNPQGFEGSGGHRPQTTWLEKRASSCRSKPRTPNPQTATQPAMKCQLQPRESPSEAFSKQDCCEDQYENVESTPAKPMPRNTAPSA